MVLTHASLTFGQIDSLLDYDLLKKVVREVEENIVLNEVLSEAEALNEKGLAELEKANYEAAIEYFSLAISEKNIVPWYLSNRAKAYELSGFTVKAIQDYTAVIQKFSYWDSYWIERGRLKMSMSDYRGALIDFEHVVSKARESSRNTDLSEVEFIPKAYMVSCLAALKRNREAIDLCVTLIQDCLEHIAYCRDSKVTWQSCKAANEVLPSVYAQLGLLYYNTNNLEDACMIWSKAGELGNTKAYEYIEKVCQ